MYERQVRSPQEGLIILYPLQVALGKDSPRAAVDTEVPLVGYLLSFPASDRAEPISYQVNKILWDQEYGTYEDEDEETM